MIRQILILILMTTLLLVYIAFMYGFFKYKMVTTDTYWIVTFLFFNINVVLLKKNKIKKIK